MSAPSTPEHHTVRRECSHECSTIVHTYAARARAGPHGSRHQTHCGLGFSCGRRGRGPPSWRTQVTPHLFLFDDARHDLFFLFLSRVDVLRATDDQHVLREPSGTGRPGSPQRDLHVQPQQRRLKTTRAADPGTSASEARNFNACKPALALSSFRVVS